MQFTDFAGLVNAFARSKVKYFQHAVFLKCTSVPYSKLCVLRRKILQQFVYLRIYMLVIIAASYSEADRKFQSMLHTKNRSSSVSVFGTKKSGKSTLINAMLGGEYFPYSSELPTPCKVVCSERKKGENIRLDYAGKSYAFGDSGELRGFLAGEFRKANKVSSAFEALADAEGGIFVLNYSAHLSNDETELLGEFFGKFSPPDKSRPVVIALNSIDEMYAADVVKSYERAADYIASRLEAPGWKNFVMMPVSALTWVYAKKLDGAVGVSMRKLSERLGKIDYREKKSAVEFLSERVRDKNAFTVLK